LVPGAAVAPALGAADAGAELVVELELAGGLAALDDELLVLLLLLPHAASPTASISAVSAPRAPWLHKPQCVPFILSPLVC
jgi:hypothetical protein